MGGSNSSELAKENIRKEMVQTFENCSNNKLVKRTDFNQAIRAFQSLNYVTVCNTYLSNRLFDVIDVKRNGTIDKETLIQRFSKLIDDQKNRMKFSFRVFDLDGDGRISRVDFCEYLQRLWCSQYMVIFERIRHSPGFEAEAIEGWFKEKKLGFNQVARSLFEKIGNKKEYIEVSDFEAWVASGEYDVVLFKYKDFKIKFPVNLQSLLAL